MSYELLAEEIKTLPESYISEISDFVVYLKLKSKFEDFENQNDSYTAALSAWREKSKDLFNEDAQFMNTAFETNRSKEIYKTKEIW